MLGGTAAVAVGAAGGLIAGRAVAADLTLPVSAISRSILPGTVTKGMMSFGAGGPPPTLRLLRDRPFSIDVVNDLDEATSVHWHGLRIANAMDGVPYLTQRPIAAGESFRYTLTPPDAGTYWYHPHCNTLDQMARGLTGVLVVEDDEDAGFDQDLPLNIRDFRLGEDGQFIELFKARNAARGGTLGTVSTVNWEVTPIYDLPAGSLVRLRLAVTDVTRIGTYDLDGGTAKVIALDANPLRQPVAPRGIVVAPG
ncbi:multicopper oxidase domain-containing protein [Mesorhizobium sp. M0019]